MTSRRAPEGLDTAGKRLWRSVTAEYELAAHELELLRQAAATADLIARAGAVLAGDDLTVEGSMGQPVGHPMIAVLADQRRLLASLFRAMGVAAGEDDAILLDPGPSAWRRRGAA
jgi:hypothetical protein